jgi:SAM-dependent methyltransferase
VSCSCSLFHTFSPFFYVYCFNVATAACVTRVMQVGVGAWSRVLLNKYPASTMVGVDHAAKAIDIASHILPKSRSQVLVGDMAALPPLGTFDFILAPGVLCYHRTLRVVRESMNEYIRMLRPGGGLCASILPESTEMLGSCSTYIPQDFWSSIPNFCWISTESMRSWLVDSTGFKSLSGRYSMCGRKC